MAYASGLDFPETEAWHKAAYPPSFSNGTESERVLVVVRNPDQPQSELMIGYYTKLRDGRNVWFVEEEGHWFQDGVTHWKKLPPLPCD